MQSLASLNNSTFYKMLPLIIAHLILIFIYKLPLDRYTQEKEQYYSTGSI